MFEILDKIFRKKDNTNTEEPAYTKEYLTKGEYYSCRMLEGGITFFHNDIRVCCSNNLGVKFVDNYKGEDVDWNDIQTRRAKIIDNCKRGIVPENCKKCVDLEYKKWGNNSLIDNIFFNYWDHCNCGCVYCIQTCHGQYLVEEKRPSDYYSILNQIKYLYENNFISKDVHIEFIGGEIAVLDEGEELINYCLDRGVGIMTFHSSCINYSKAIERAFREAPMADMDFSIDCASRELYKKIKRIDAFDQVIENIKRYLACSEKAKDSLIAKYIIVDGLNDSVEEISNWIDLMYKIGIRVTKVDVNFKKFFPEFHHSDPTVPEHYYKMLEAYNRKIEEYGIRDCSWEFTKRIFKDGKLV